MNVKIFQYNFSKLMKKIIMINCLVLMILLTFLFWEYQPNNTVYSFSYEGIIELELEEKLIDNLKEIKIDQKKITFKIVNISDEIYYDSKFKKHRKVTLKTENIENDFYEIIIFREKTTIIKKIIKYLKEMTT